MLEIVPIQHEGRPLLLVSDPLQILEGVAVLPPDPLVMAILQLADGRRSVDDIAQAAREATGLIITTDKVRNVVAEMDEALLLYSDRLAAKWRERQEAFREQPVRRSTVFPGEDRLALLKELGDEFRRHRLSRKSPPDRLDFNGASVRAILSPHIDYARGGEAYAWAYQALAQHSQATTFIVLGTLHRPASHLFIATGKTFETPLGPVETDRDLLDELKAEFPGELFEEEFQHASEHTIELQALYLKHALRDRPFRIVPILVSSFEEYLHTDPPTDPRHDEEIRGFCNALKTLLQRHGDRVALIGGVDFSHCGAEFGDDFMNTPEVEGEIRELDQRMLAAIEAVDPSAFWDSFQEDGNERKVCSIAPIYCVLSALEGDCEGRTLLYDQANSADRSCMVTFASVAFTTKAAPKSKIILLS